MADLFMRQFRLAHKISMHELASAAGVSEARIYQIETGECSPEQQEQIPAAFATVIRRRERALRKLREEFAEHKSELFTPTKEDEKS